MSSVERLTKVLRDIKYRLNITQATLSDMVGYKSTYLSDVINGRVPLSERFIGRLSEAFPDYDPIWIMTGVGKMKSNDLQTDNVNCDDMPAAKVRKVSKNEEEDSLSTNEVTFRTWSQDDIIKFLSKSNEDKEKMISTLERLNSYLEKENQQLKNQLNEIQKLKTK